MRLPGVLRAAVGDVREVTVEGETVREAVEDLCRQHPTVRVRILDEDGRLRPHVLCVVNGVTTRLEDPMSLTDGDDLTIMPAVSGG